MTKRWMAFAAGLLAFALAGCAQPPVTATTDVTEPDDSAAGSYKACLITDAGSASDGSPAQQAISGLDRAQRELGIETNSVTADSAADYPRVLQSLVDAQCSIVVALGSGMADSVEAAAKTNTDVQFALVDATPNTAPPNLRPVLFSTHESSFLAGYLAAARSASGKVGVFGALSVPAVTIYMDGFVQGVDYYNQAKGAQVQALGWDLAAQDGTFVRSDAAPYQDQAAGRVAAEALTAQGADVIMAVAGDSGTGALQLAADTGTLKVIWTDTNGCLTEAVACDQQLGSVVKDRGSAVYELIRADKDGRNASGVFTAALRNDGTALVEARDGDFGADLTAELDRIAKDIIDGSISVTSPSAIG